MRLGPSSFAVLMTAAIGVALAGCAGPRWAEVRYLADPEFADGALPVGTIDLLPIDLQVWSHDGRDPDTILAALDEIASNALAIELGARGFALGARIDPAGRFYGGDGRPHQAMSADAIGQTLDSLSSYGSAETQAGPGELLVPFLPHRLGDATRADATLYVGGWAFAGAPQRSRGAKVARVIGYVALAAVAVVLVVAIVAAAKGGDGLGGLGHAASGVARVAGGTLQVAGRVASVAARAVVHAGRITVHVADAVARSRSAYDLADLTRATLEITSETLPTPTHVAIVAGRPNWFARPGAPRKGGSRMMLELTLIDNHTGRVLWHARQELGADPTRPNDVARAVRHMLGSLPAR